MKLRAKITIIACYAVVLVASVVILFPIQVLHAREKFHRALGNEEKARALWNEIGMLEAEADIREIFGEDAVWVELPRDYAGIAGRRILVMVPACERVSMVTTPNNQFSICVPESMEELFTIEELDKFRQTQPDWMQNE